MQVADAATEHEVGLVAVEVFNGTDTRAVDNPEREIVQQVAIGVYVEFLGKNFCLGGSYTFEV